MLNQETVAQFMKASGGTFDRFTSTATFELQQLRNFVAAIAGQAILDAEHGDLFKDIHLRNKALEERHGELLAALNDVVRCDEANTGNEPSVSCFYRAIDQAKAVIAKAGA